MSRSLLIRFVLSAVATSLPAQDTASISGTLTGDDGATVAGIVTIHKMVPPAANGRAVAGKDGSFTISSLAAGSYAVCVAAAGNGYMDPCAWSAPPTTVQVSAGQALTGYALTLKKGVAVQVRLNDPGSVLGAVAQPNHTVPHVLLGFLTTRGLFQPLTEVSKDATGHNLQGVIPANISSARLYVGGQGVTITDSNGNDLDPKGTPITVSQTGGASPSLVTLTVAH